jgi:hypothetical protein
VTDRAVFAIEIALVALAFAIHVARLSRKRLLSFKYTVGWMSVCLFGIFASGFLGYTVGKDFTADPDCSLSGYVDNCSSGNFDPVICQHLG